MTNYSRGYAFERRVHADLTEDGYEVVESRGSHGLADLVAMKPGQTLLVQCKTGHKSLTHDEWNGLADLAVRAGAIAIIADRPVRGKVRYRRITGRHEPRSHTWPCVPFTADLLI